jgi:O-antigen ligase
MSVEGLSRARLTHAADRVAFGALLGCVLLSPVGQSLQEAAAVLALAAWLTSLAAGHKGLPRTGAGLPILLWLGAALLSLTHSVDLSASVSGLRKILKGAAVLFIAADLVRTPRRLRWLLGTTLASVLLISVDGLVQVATGMDVLARMPAGDMPGHFHRLSAAFHHANEFAVYGVSLLPVCLALALGADPMGRGRLLGWTATALLSAALLLTFSRPAAVALAISLSAFWVIRRAWKTLAALAAASVAGYFLLPSAVRAWVASQPSWFDALVQPLRKEIWHAALQMIAAHPVTGVGVNTFVLNYARYKLPSDAQQAAYGHNLYLHLTAEIGLLGLAAFGFLLARAAGAWRRLLASREPGVAAIAAGVGCGVVGFLAIGLLESSLQSSRTNVWFWLWLGVLFGLGLSRAPRGGQREPR